MIIMFLRFQAAYAALNFYDVSVAEMNLVLMTNKNTTSVAYRYKNSYFSCTVATNLCIQFLLGTLQIINFRACL